MNYGFIFNQNRCVACGACSAACMLENKWTFRARKIFTRNSEVVSSLPVINLSLACNHCKDALCMEGCPSSAYRRDSETGAIIIEDSQCIACRYCQWNCPYDAPKYVSHERVIAKCHLCHQRLREDLIPACATACPTGALVYDKLDDIENSLNIPWFPDKNLGPAIRLTGSNFAPATIIPVQAFDSSPDIRKNKVIQSAPEWSLIGFSFLTTLSVAQILDALITGQFPDRISLFLLITLACISSFFHLGKKMRAWKALMNIRSSPLSREIGLFILYFLQVAVAGILQLPFLFVLSSVTGLLLLCAIDAVYIFSDKRKSVFLHSGQTFISGLLIVSFLTGKIIPFMFIAVLCLASSIWQIRTSDNGSLLTVMKFIRISILIITGAAAVSGVSHQETEVICLFLGGELLNRIIFYVDFKPLNINRLNEDLINKATR
jgi:Fe-S-cluster-containing dehydrogenase component/DMSO reductase anchor subunit